MADEPRRSGRATKGQHTKNDTPEPAQKKGKGRKKAQKEEPEPEPEEEEAIIRCICGYVVEDPRDKRAMICCDKCDAWQHNIHMGVSEDEDELPPQYFCEQCKPEDHKELLDAIARGEKPWDAREAEAKAAKLASRKKGKGGRKSAVAEKETVASNITAPPAQVPAPQVDIKQETGTKRKLPNEPSAGSPIAENGANKIRKMTTQKQPARQQSFSSVADSTRRDSQSVGTTLQTELVENIEELNEKARKGAATGLLKTFTDAANEAIQTGAFQVPAGQDVSYFALKLALNVEYALYMSLWTRGATAQTEYGTQCRAIMHNVKQNTELRDKIFSNQVSPLDLSKMTSENMQSQEMQQKTAEWKKQIEKQSVITSDPDAMLRQKQGRDDLLHNSAAHEFDSSSSFHPAPRLNDPDTKAENQIDGDQPGSPNEVELPAEIQRARAPGGTHKLSVDTKRRRSSGQHLGRKPSANFDVDKVWSSVESPGTPARPTPTQSSRPTPSNTKADPDIDRLLKDENEDEEEYSPADYTPDPDTVWGGSVIMATVADFRATAKHAAAANLSTAYPWSRLMPSVLNIEGRIDIERAEAYLCGLQYSKTKDLTVVSLVPADHLEDKASFNKLFEYFTTRKRYGVIRKSPVDQARDIYVIPLDAGSGGLPPFLDLLQEHSIEQPRKTRMLLIAYVINCTPEGESNLPTPSGVASSSNQDSYSANQAQIQRTPSVSQHMSPIAPPQTQSTPQYSNIPPNPYAQSPSAIQQKFASPPQPSPAYPPQYQMPQSNGRGVTGLAAAISVLGLNEFKHIKDVFTADPSTMHSLDALIPKLQARIRGEGGA